MRDLACADAIEMEALELLYSRARNTFATPFATFAITYCYAMGPAAPSFVAPCIVAPSVHT